MSESEVLNMSLNCVVMRESPGLLYGDDFGDGYMDSEGYSVGSLQNRRR